MNGNDAPWWMTMCASRVFALSGFERGGSMNTRKDLAFWLVIALLLPAVGAQAQDAAGTVKKVKGEVSIVRDGASIMASPGVKVMTADRIVTGPDSSVGVTLQDDTLLAFGPRSASVLNEFRYDPVRRDGSLIISILEGSMRFVTGQLGKQNPDAVDIRLPTTAVGIRGTDFIVAVERGK
jgi:hypothetical protein